MASPAPPPRRPPPKPQGLPVAKEELGAGTGTQPQLRTRPEPPRLPHEAPTVFVDPEPTMSANRQPTPEPAASPPPRTQSPPGGIKLEVGGHRITVSQMALVAILTLIGGAGVGAKVASDGATETSDVLVELRGMRKDVKDLQGDIADVREDQRRARSNDTKILNYVEDSLSPVFASLGKLGVKFQFAGRQPEPVEFHPAPMPGSNAPAVQPKTALPERPTL